MTNDDVLAFIEEANEINRMLAAAARGAIARGDKDNLLRYLKAHAGRLQALERHVEGLPEEPDLPRSDPAGRLSPSGGQFSVPRTNQINLTMVTLFLLTPCRRKTRSHRGRCRTCQRLQPSWRFSVALVPAGEPPSSRA